MIDKHINAHVIDKLYTYPYIMATGTHFRRVLWLFEQDDVMKTFELYESRDNVSFYEKSPLQTKRIHDIEKYVSEIMDMLEYSKTNYYNNKQVIKNVSTILGKDCGIAFDECRWLRKRDPQNYVKICLNVFRNSYAKSINVEYCRDGNVQHMICDIDTLLEFLKTIPVFHTSEQNKIIKARHQKKDPPMPKEQPDITKLSKQLDNLFVRNSKAYNLTIQTCKAPPDQYAFLLREDS
jgi:hypothetical protein